MRLKNGGLEWFEKKYFFAINNKIVIFAWKNLYIIR